MPLMLQGISDERPKQAVVSSKILGPFPLKLGTSFRISAFITVPQYYSIVPNWHTKKKKSFIQYLELTKFVDNVLPTENIVWGEFSWKINFSINQS